MLQIYQKKLKFTVDVRSLPTCTIDDRTVRLMPLSGPRVWTDREPFPFEEAVAYDDSFEMKETNSLWPNFFVGINGGNWMVLDGVLRSESQVDAPIVRYGQGDVMSQTLVAWCTGGEGAPLHPNPYRPEVLVIFATSGVLTFDGVVRIFNTTAEDTYDYTSTIATQDQHRIVANIRSEGDVYTLGPESQIRAAGQLIGQLTWATHLDQVRQFFAGLVVSASGTRVATALGKLYSWSNTLETWTIAPYYDGGVVHVATSEFLDEQTGSVGITGSVGLSSVPASLPQRSDVQGVAQRADVQALTTAQSNTGREVQNLVSAVSQGLANLLQAISSDADFSYVLADVSDADPQTWAAVHAYKTTDPSTGASQIQTFKGIASHDDAEDCPKVYFDGTWGGHSDKWELANRYLTFLFGAHADISGQGESIWTVVRVPFREILTQLDEHDGNWRQVIPLAWDAQEGQGPTGTVVIDWIDENPDITIDQALLYIGAQVQP